MHTSCLASEALVQTYFRRKRLSIVYQMVSKGFFFFRECFTYNMTNTTDSFTNQGVPNYVFVSIHRCYLPGIGEKSTIIHIHSIIDSTGFDFWIVLNYFIDFGFFKLALGPIWEKGLWISLPAIIATFIAMVTVFWDRKFNGFELHGVDFCKPYKHNDEANTGVFSRAKKTTFV